MRSCQSSSSTGLPAARAFVTRVVGAASALVLRVVGVAEPGPPSGGMRWLPRSATETAQSWAVEFRSTQPKEYTVSKRAEQLDCPHVAGNLLPW